MVSFSSSVINKSGKKFAPKAPIRRGGPAGPTTPNAPPSSRPSVERRASVSKASQPPPAKPIDPPPSGSFITNTVASSESRPPQTSQPVSETSPAVPKGTKTTPITPGTRRKPSTSLPAHNVPESAVARQDETASNRHSDRQTQTPLAGESATVDLAAETSEAVPVVPAARRPEVDERGKATPNVEESIRKLPDTAGATLIQPAKRRRISETSISPGRLGEPEIVPATLPQPQTQPVHDTHKTEPIPIVAGSSQRSSNSVHTTRAQPPRRGRGSRIQQNAVATAAPTSTAVEEPINEIRAATPLQDGSTAVGGGQHAQASAGKPKKQPAKPRRKRVAVDDTADGSPGTNKPRVSRPRKKRALTPENAEVMEITPSVIKMSDLCKDMRTGKKSKREIELRNMDAAEAARKQKEKEDGKKAMSTPQEQDENVLERMARKDEERERERAAARGGPQMRIVNGEIVLDTSSLQIDRHADAAKDAEDMEEVEENPLTRRINQASFGKRTKSESWDEVMTDLFYKGLRIFGTDFMMISKMFPGRSRRQIKLKFNNEERRDPERIKESLLGPRESLDLAAYAEMSNMVFDDPRVIQRELDDERQRIEEEHAKEREAQQEMFLNSGGDNVLPSIENGEATRKKRNTKKGQSIRNFGGGTEEVLGSIDD